MKRIKNLAYRILKTCYDSSPGKDAELEEQGKHPEPVNLMTHKDFSDLSMGEGLIYLHTHYHMLGNMGCFLWYDPDFFAPIVIRALSWRGHDLLEQLELEIQEEESSD